MGTIPAPDIFHDSMQIAQAPQNALAEFARVAQLKQQTEGMQQQQQQSEASFPLEQQAREQQIEAQRRQLADQDALTKAITQYDPAKHTLADVPKLVTSNGGSGSAALQAQQGLITQRQKLTQLSDEQFAEEQKKADLIAGVHDQVSQAKPEEKQGIYQQGMQRLSAAGVDVSKEPTQYPGDDQFAQHLPAIRLHSAIVAEAEKDRELSTKEQEESNKEWKDFPALGVALNTRTGEQKSVSGGAAQTPAMMEAKYVALGQKENSGQKLSADDAAWKKSYEHMKTLVPVANFNLQNAGAAADNNGNPSQIAQAIAENRMKWSEAVSPRTPQSVKNAIMAQVYKLNPNYDTSEFGLEADAAKKARSGAWADTRLAYNTAIDHAQQLLSAADALKNSDVQKWNSLKNFFKTQFGYSGPMTYSAIANAYNHEVTSVVSKGHITDAEVQQGHATLPENASPDQMHDVANAYMSLMSSKRDELDKIIKAGAGNKANSVLKTEAGGGGQSSGHKVGDLITQNGHTFKATKVDSSGKVLAADPQ